MRDDALTFSSYPEGKGLIMTKSIEGFCRSPSRPRGAPRGERPPQPGRRGGPTETPRGNRRGEATSSRGSAPDRGRQPQRPRPQPPSWTYLTRTTTTTITTTTTRPRSTPSRGGLSTRPKHFQARRRGTTPSYHRTTTDRNHNSTSRTSAWEDPPRRPRT